MKQIEKKQYKRPPKTCSARLALYVLEDAAVYSVFRVRLLLDIENLQLEWVFKVAVVNYGVSGRGTHAGIAWGSLGIFLFSPLLA